MKPWLITDVDGTLYRWQLFMDWLEKLAPRYPAIQEMVQDAEPVLHAYRARKGPFMQYGQMMVKKFWDEKRYVGIKRSDAIRAAEEVVASGGHRMYVFTRELIAAAKSLGWGIAAISGSPQETVETLLKPFGFDVIKATGHLITAEGVYADGPVTFHVERKGETLREIAAENGIPLELSVAIGDSSSDAKMLELVKWPVCFNPNREFGDIALEKKWPFVIESRNTDYILVTEPSGQRRGRVQEILPPDLADCFQKRLDDVNW
jgi:HAD superfamily phosphoserine phosphatase-like hydrolase